jgi:hypothetical protein
MPRIDTYHHLLSGDKLLSRKGTFEGIESSIVGKATRWRRLSLVQECSVYGVLWWRVALALAFFFDLFHWNHGWPSWWLVRPNIVPVMYYDRIVILRNVVPNTSRSCHSTSTLLHSSCFPQNRPLYQDTSVDNIWGVTVFGTVPFTVQECSKCRKGVAIACSLICDLVMRLLLGETVLDDFFFFFIIKITCHCPFRQR